MRPWLVLATLLLLFAGCVMPPRAPPPPGEAGEASGAESAGRSVDIGNGRTMFLECKGEGSPTVILESGIHDSSDYWVNVQPNPPAIGPDVFSGVAEHTQVCRYDRPGTLIPGEQASLTDRSTPVANPRTIEQVATDLDALIEAAGLEGPFLMVGHSFGGWLQTYYTQTRADAVEGLVLVDAFSARMPEFMGDTWTSYALVLNDPLGTAISKDPAWETYDVLASVRQAEVAPPLPQDLPMAVLSKTKSFPIPPNTKGFTSGDLDSAWLKTQDALAKLVPNSPHVIAEGSDHYIQIREPDLVTSTIVLIVERARAEN